jgi:hemerythrin
MEQSVWTIHWNESLSVDIPEIDVEHQHFISLVNDLNAAIIARQQKPEIERLLILIIADARSHFEHEERLFAEHGYPDAAHHAELHAELTSQFLGVLDSFKDAGRSYRWIEAGLLIKKLLVDHLLEEDMKYRHFLGVRMKRFGA